MGAIDRNNSETLPLSDKKCSKCGKLIPSPYLDECDQGDGTYICQECLSDSNSEELREKMGRD